MDCFYVKRSIRLKAKYSNFSFQQMGWFKRSKWNFQQHESILHLSLVVFLLYYLFLRLRLSHSCHFAFLMNNLLKMIFHVQYNKHSFSLTHGLSMCISFAQL